jgi:hypothetical protein
MQKEMLHFDSVILIDTFRPDPPLNLNEWTHSPPFTLGPQRVVLAGAAEAAGVQPETPSSIAPTTTTDPTRNLQTPVGVEVRLTAARMRAQGRWRREQLQDGADLGSCRGTRGPVRPTSSQRPEAGPSVTAPEGVDTVPVSDGRLP